MEIVDFGHFIGKNSTGILFYENEHGQDWYELRAGLTTWDERGNFLTAIYGTWAIVDMSGIVTNVEYDPSRLVPDNRTVIGIDADPAEVSKGMRYEGGLLLPALPVSPAATVLYPVDLWSRLTENEADQVEAAMATQSARVLNIFRTASSYRSDHELWSLLENTAIALFGASRAAQILAPSE